MIKTTTQKKTVTYVVGNPGPGLGQAQNCGRVKHLYFKNLF
jgi:hypothetical protein